MRGFMFETRKEKGNKEKQKIKESKTTESYLLVIIRKKK